MSIEAMKLMVEALEHSHANEPIWKTPHREAIEAGRAAIEQAERAPHKVPLHEFLIAVKDKENFVGVPMIYAEWPTRGES